MNRKLNPKIDTELQHTFAVDVEQAHVIIYEGEVTTFLGKNFVKDAANKDFLTQFNVSEANKFRAVISHSFRDKSCIVEIRTENYAMALNMGEELEVEIPGFRRTKMDVRFKSNSGEEPHTNIHRFAIKQSLPVHVPPVTYLDFHIINGTRFFNREPKVFDYFEVGGFKLELRPTPHKYRPPHLSSHEYDITHVSRVSRVDRTEFNPLD